MLESLRHFVLIVAHGTFTEAARRAHLSQPALTASIRRLEEAMGARLLVRGRRGASCTAEGEALLPHAQAALAALEDGRRAVEEVSGLRRGEVRVGAGATACTYLLPPWLAELRRRHPGVRILLRESTTEEALDALGRGELDLAIVSHGEGELWLQDELVLVRAPETAAQGAPFVTFRAGATTRALLDRHFPEARIAMELGSIAAVKGNVRAGIGVALVSRAAVTEDLRAGRLVLVPDPRTPLVRALSLVHRGRERLSPAAAELRRLLLEERLRPGEEGAG